MNGLQPIITKFRFQEGKHLPVAGPSSAAAGGFCGLGSS
jgi:hypothetical protein